jgi:hypothetical protein
MRIKEIYIYQKKRNLNKNNKLLNLRTRQGIIIIRMKKRFKIIVGLIKFHKKFLKVIQDLQIVKKFKS